MKISLLLISFVLIWVPICYCSPFNVTNDVTQFIESQLEGNTKLNFSILTGFILIDWYYPGTNSSLFFQIATQQGEKWNQSVSPDTSIFFWFNGGPGTSSQLGSWEQLGPLGAKFSNESKLSFGNVTIYLREYSWNREVMLVFIDEPLNVGFSYSNVPDLLLNNSETAAEHIENFFYNFYSYNPQLMANQLYLTGESYAGHYVPCFAKRLLESEKLDQLFSEQGNTQFREKFVGIFVGDGIVNMQKQEKYFDSFYYSIGLASGQMRSSILAKEIEGENIFNRNPLNGTDSFVNFWSTVKPSADMFGGVNKYNFAQYPPSGQQAFQILLGNRDFTDPYGIPRDCVYGQNSQGDIEYAFRLDQSLPFDSYYTYLLSSNIRVFLYEGQNDILLNHPAALRWLNQFDWDNRQNWQSTSKIIWKIDQNGDGLYLTAGNFKVYQNFCYCVVYNSGHLVPTDQPKAAYEMMQSFLSWNFTGGKNEQIIKKNLTK